MAKIDTTKIAGYSDMSAEEKLAALEAFEYEDSVPDLQRYKDAVTRANREDVYKRQCVCYGVW